MYSRIDRTRSQPTILPHSCASPMYMSQRDLAAVDGRRDFDGAAGRHTNDEVKPIALQVVIHSFGSVEVISAEPSFMPQPSDCRRQGDHDEHCVRPTRGPYCRSLRTRGHCILAERGPADTQVATAGESTVGLTALDRNQRDCRTAARRHCTCGAIRRRSRTSPLMRRRSRSRSSSSAASTSHANEVKPLAGGNPLVRICRDDLAASSRRSCRSSGCRRPMTSTA